MDTDKRKITIIALGGGGCKVMKEFVSNHDTSRFRLLAIDSDAESLRDCGLPEESWLQAGRLLRSGRGCGGDVIAGQQALANERKQLAALLADTDILIITACLGGGLATGGLPVILGVAAKLRIASAVLVSLPFNMEGFQRRKQAEDKIKNDMLPIAEAVITLPNDLLFTSMNAEISMQDAFRRSDVELSRTLFSLSSILGGGNLFSADFSSLMGVLKRRHTLCSLGTAMVDAGENAASRLMDELLISPLLGGPEALDNADSVIFSLLGGPELSMGTARAVLDLCSRHVDQDLEKKLILGAASGEEFTGKVMLTALTVRCLDSAAKPAAGAKRSFNNDNNSAADNGEQLFLDLEVESKGIMENTNPVMLDGEDLDVPTFRRRNLVIDFGK